MVLNLTGPLLCLVSPAQGAVLGLSGLSQTIRDWNDLPDALFTTAEMSDDCVSSSLVHSRN